MNMTYFIAEWNNYRIYKKYGDYADLDASRTRDIFTLCADLLGTSLLYFHIPSDISPHPA